MEKGLAPSTVRHVHRATAAVFDVAMEDRAISRNPVRKANGRGSSVKLPQVQTEEMEILSPAEVAGLVDAVPERWSALIRLAAASGLRFGELAGLKISDLNWPRRSLTVSRQMNREGELAEVKTKSSRRALDLDQRTVEFLSAHVAKFGGESEFLFTGPDGGSLNYGNFRKRV
jgi:integrase